MHKILRTLILSDLFLLGSFGLIEPIFAVFMLKNIVGTTLTAIGAAATIQLVTKAIFQIIVSKWTDEEKGNKRELYALFLGSLIMSVVPFFYLLANSLAHVYLLQFAYGLGTALVFPGWMVIYTRYSRDEKAGYEWSMYNTIISLGSAAAAFLGAYIADIYSFNYIFIGVGILSLIGTSLLVHVFRHEFTHGWVGHTKK